MTKDIMPDNSPFRVGERVRAARRNHLYNGRDTGTVERVWIEDKFMRDGPNYTTRQEAIVKIRWDALPNNPGTYTVSAAAAAFEIVEP